MRLLPFVGAFSFVALSLVASPAAAADDVIIGWGYRLVGLGTLDLDVHMTLGGEDARERREEMDRNGDGHVSRAEVEAEEADIGDEFASEAADLPLRLDGSPYSIDLRLVELTGVEGAVATSTGRVTLSIQVDGRLGWEPSGKETHEFQGFAEEDSEVWFEPPPGYMVAAVTVIQRKGPCEAGGRGGEREGTFTVRLRKSSGACGESEDEGAALAVEPAVPLVAAAFAAGVLRATWSRSGAGSRRP